MDVPSIRVYYRDLRCHVFRPFYTREGAKEFIDVNAMVYPLPELRVTEVVSWSPFKEVEITL